MIKPFPILGMLGLALAASSVHAQTASSPLGATPIAILAASPPPQSLANPAQAKKDDAKLLIPGQGQVVHNDAKSPNVGQEKKDKEPNANKPDKLEPPGRPEILNPQEAIRRMLEEIRAAQEKFLEEQKELQKKVKDAKDEQRDRIRAELRDKRELFLQQQKDMREEFRKRVDELKDQLKDHRDVIDDAKEQAKDKVRQRKGGGD